MAMPTMNKKNGITKSARLQPFHGACPITGHCPPASSTKIISCIIKKKTMPSQKFINANKSLVSSRQEPKKRCFCLRFWHWIEVTKVDYNLFELPRRWGHERCRGKRHVSAWKACGLKYRVLTRWVGGGEWSYRLWFRPFCDVNGVWALMMRVRDSVQLKAKVTTLRVYSQIAMTDWLHGYLSICNYPSRGLNESLKYKIYYILNKYIKITKNHLYSDLE